MSKADFDARLSAARAALIDEIANAAYGLTALKDLIDAVELKLDTSLDVLVSSRASVGALAAHDLNISTLIAALNDISAADVWTYGTRALTDKAGFSLSAAGVNAVRDSILNDATRFAGANIGTILSEIQDGTYGLSALNTKLDDLTGSHTPYIINLTATGIIHTPASGKKIRLKGFMWSSNADVVTALRFGTGGDLLFALQAKGVVGMNLIGCNIEGAVDEALYGYLSGTGTMRGTVLLEEI